MIGMSMQPITLQLINSVFDFQWYRLSFHGRCQMHGPPHVIVGEKQPIQWFLRGKVAVIQQGTSVWVGSPSPTHPLHFQELYPCEPTAVIVRNFNIHYHLSLHFCQNLSRGGRGTMHNPTHNLQVSKQMRL